MKLVVLGATGATGIEIVRQAIERGHSVRALVRSARRLESFAPSIDIIEGDLLDAGQLARAISGQEAVLSAFGPRQPRRKQRLVGPFARALTHAMDQVGVTRLLILSVAFLFRDSLLPPAYALGQLFLRHHVADCADMEAVVQGSGLDWTIVRLPQLTNRPRSATYRLGVQHLPLMGMTIPRANVAEFMLQAAEDRSYSRRIVGLAR